MRILRFERGQDVVLLAALLRIFCSEKALHVSKLFVSVFVGCSIKSNFKNEKTIRIAITCTLWHVDVSRKLCLAWNGTQNHLPVQLTIEKFRRIEFIGQTGRR
jgi:hypothetical protein